MDRHLGVRGVEPLAGEGSSAPFGVLTGQAGAPVAVLTLTGPDLTLADPRRAHAAHVAWLAALPATPLQLLLSRRLLPPADAGMAGAASVWSGAVVGAPDEATLAQRVAALYLRLPAEATPLPAADLLILLARLVRPDLAPDDPDLRPERGLADLLPRKLTFHEDRVGFVPGAACYYWLLGPPFPATPGGPWGPLLTHSALTPYNWDLAVHLRPALVDPAMRAVAERRLAWVEHELAARGGAPTGPPPRRNGSAQGAAWRLELERRDLEERIAAEDGGSERAASILLALHSEDNAAGAHTAAQFAAALAVAGYHPRPVHGRTTLQAAVHAHLPLADGAGLRAFPLGPEGAATLAAVPPARPSAPPAAPLVGLDRARRPVFLAPGDDQPGHVLVLGGSDAQRRRLVAPWAEAAVTGGVGVLIYDPAGAWSAWVGDLGGEVLRPGAPDGPGAGLLAPPLAVLNEVRGFEMWGREVGALLLGLLAGHTPDPPDVLEGHLGAALLQCGLRALEVRNTKGLTLLALAAELRAGGLAATADALARLAAHPLGRLFAPPAPPAGGLRALGPAVGLPPALAARLLTLALHRALAAPRPPRLCLIDPLPAALASASIAADLADHWTGASPMPVPIWALVGAEDGAALLAGPQGAALRAVPTQVWMPPGAALLPCAAALGLPGPAQAALPTLAANEVLLYQAGVAEIVTRRV